MRRSRYWAALVLAACTGAAAQLQWSGAEPEIGPVRDSAAASPSYRLESVRIGGHLEGVATSPSYKLEFLPAYGTPPVDTTPGDVTPPLVVITRPGMDTIVNTPVFTVEYTVDGVAGFQEDFTLLEGMNILVVDSTDAAGNRGADTVRITLDTQPPIVIITSPGGDTVVSTPTIALAYTVDGDPRSRLFSLSQGSNLLQVDATDAAGNIGSDAIVVGLDSQGPSLAVVPFHQQVLSELLVPLKVTFSDSGSGITLESLQVLLDGQEITPSLTIAGDSAVTVVSTSEGLHHLSVRLVDKLGNVTTLESDFTCTLPPPPLVLTAPANLSTVRTADVLVAGQIQSPVSQIRVDGVLATVAGTGFQALVPLVDGKNTLLATGFDPEGQQVSATLTITLDREKPRIYITSPIDGAVIVEDSIVVIGSVSDRIADIQGQSMPAVRVNGLDAVVVNNTFRAKVPLTSGPNTLTAVAADKAGNLESAVVNVTMDQAAQPTLSAHAGQEQSAPVYSALPLPLQVVVRDAAGQPVAGQPVLFRVTLGDGAFAGGNRLLQVHTNTQGLASAGFTLGRRAGPGANEVTTEAAGFSGKGVFHPYALEQPAYRILTTSGDMQRGVAGNAAPQALIALVTDSAGNPVSGVPVIFKVEKGGGHFLGRNADTSVTGADGRAAAAFTLGPEEGRDNNRVVASFPGNPSQGAYFVLSGYIPGPAAQTRVSGVILDNSNHPLRGVTVRIEENGQQTITDSSGQFVLVNAPVGILHLHVDGTTSSRPGDWVTLMFELNAISGKDNDIGMPIYLVARNNVEGKEANASQDQVITLAEIPGFALKVPAGSATFPAEVDDNIVTVTSVHTDKIPMPPGEGMQPRFIISVGPPSVKFDPPAPITYPNVDGLKPGEQTHLYSFDHDLGTFVSIGTGTVSEDGATITSDKGFGIVKGGWHCAGPSNPVGSAEPPSVRLTAKTSSKVCQDEIVKIETRCKPVLGRMDWSAPGASIDSKSEEVLTDNGAPLVFSTSYPTPGLKDITGTWSCKSGAQTTEAIRIVVEEKPEESKEILPDPTVLAVIAPNPASETYDVTGFTADEIAAQLVSFANSNGGEAGSMEGGFIRKLPNFLPPEVKDGGCGVKIYTYHMVAPIIPTSTLIKLPNWVDKNSPNAEPEAKTRFASFMQCLEPHEYMHQTLYNEATSEYLPPLFKVKLEIVSSKPPREVAVIAEVLQAEFNFDLISNYNSASDLIDLKTKSIDPITCTF